MEAFKKFIFWFSDVIVSGTVAAIKFIPVADRFLARWSGKLLSLMLKHKLASLIVLIALPLVSFFILEEDGIFEPVSDALDMFIDLFDLAPLELLAIIIPLGLLAAIGTVQYKSGLSFGQAAGRVFFAVGARVLYLFIIMFVIMTLLQFTPLKSNNRSGAAALTQAGQYSASL